MRGRFLHIVLMPADGGAVRNFRISALALRVGIVCLVGLVLALTASLAFHVKTFREAQVVRSLRAENQALRDELVDFGKAVDELDSRVRLASEREREARLLAGLEPVDEDTRRLGIGGPFLQLEPSGAIAGAGLREELRNLGSRLDAAQREVGFQEQSYHQILTILNGNREKLARTPTICPVRASYTLSSGFGARVDPFTGRQGWHNGLDIRATNGAPVVAPAAGSVSSVGYDGDFGLTIRMDHGDGVQTVYCHLSRALVHPGQSLHRGETIGTVGLSGRTTGSHLHYEVWRGGRPVDPQTHILTPTTIPD